MTESKAIKWRIASRVANPDLKIVHNSAMGQFVGARPLPVPSLILESFASKFRNKDK